ncbi:MAG: hypothetical protein LKF31_00205 [Muribaculaceae bacterium]|jgi:hypothetical protein|nr:hypothetical protein [Muribaculaceae bacterium]
MKKIALSLSILCCLSLAGCSGVAKSKASHEDSVTSAAGVPVSTIDANKVEKLWDSEVINDSIDIMPDEFAFYDIDGDGLDELLLQNKAAHYGCVITFGDTTDVVGIEKPGYTIAIQANVVISSGSPEAGTYCTEYHKIVKSRDNGEWFVKKSVNDSDDAAPTLSYIGEGGKIYTAEEAESFINGIPKKIVDISNLNWKPYSTFKIFIEQ